MNPVPDISVVIPTRDRAAVLERTLAALAEQELGGIAMEVIVVDNGSPAGSLEAVSSFSATAPFSFTLLVEQRSGASAARNAGVAVARGEHILFLGDDTRPADGDLVAEHVQALSERPGARVVMGVCHWAPGIEVTPVMEWLERTRKSHDYSIFPPGEGPLTNLYANNLSLPRDALLDVGGFDERFPQYGWEDYDLALRLGDRGYRLCFLPELVVHHDHTSGLKDSLRRMESVGRTARLFNRLHAERDGLLAPRPDGPKAAIARALDPMLRRIPVPGWIPRPIRDRAFRTLHYAALARGYEDSPIPADPGLRGGIEEALPR